MNCATMPRRLRFASGGYVYHVLNRAVARNRIFAKQRDYEAFEEVLLEARERVSMRLLAWTVLPNHWFFGPAGIATSRSSCAG